ncbi:protection of telomeres protein 1b isoform X2 [Daucus carota subsp. sativus]|uniref:protection of telomeres protein 1b isoform X2 n=1 Tax=Daucus carota subsp. sativus TaxID=79200 RepID=UPI003083C361
MGKQERVDDYKFLPIADALIAINQKVNLIAVVVDSTIPKKSKGTDYYCSLNIIDKSCPSPGIAVKFFVENMGNLPQVECNGDIILLSNILMKTHNSEVYALFNKRSASFALYEGKGGSKFVPYQVSSKFRGREQDKKFIAGLRQWLGDSQLDSGEDDLLSLKDIRENEHLNLVCKVLHICEVTKDERILFVWDGTDTPVAKQKNFRQEDNVEDLLPLQLECPPLQLDVIRMFPTVGTVLRVYIDSGSEELGLHILKTGRWVQFMKMKCEIRKGMWCGVLMPFTKIRYLVDDNKHVFMCQRDYDERLKLEFGRMPWMSFPWPSHITETDYPNVSFCTLMDVLTYPEVTAKFKCVVQVIDVYPWRVEDFHSPLGTCRIRLTLEDPTARIHAYVYAEDGVHFFGGSQPIDVLKRKRNMLLGICSCDSNESKNALRDTPWVQCCIKSYYLDKHNTWGSRRYRIFGTRLYLAWSLVTLLSVDNTAVESSPCKFGEVQ